jgi:hypothetical protein
MGNFSNKIEVIIFVEHIVIVHINGLHCGISIQEYICAQIKSSLTLFTLPLHFFFFFAIGGGGGTEV